MTEYHIIGGKGPNKFVLGSIHCDGDESNLLQCDHDGNYSCEYYETIGVSCGEFQCSPYSLHCHYIPKSPSITLVLHFSLSSCASVLLSSVFCTMRMEPMRTPTSRLYILVSPTLVAKRISFCDIILLLYFYSSTMH